MKKNKHLDHLLKARETVYVPYLRAGRTVDRADPSAGRIAPDDGEASPRVTHYLGEFDTPHPFNGGMVVAVRLDEPPTGGSQPVYAVPTHRLAHDETCRRCAHVWQRQADVLARVEPGSMISTAFEVRGNRGPVRLVVDAADLVA
ncbi:MAG: hypothetical protein QM621_09220 [Aeromicrobium sp.]|uniref:hypothetical protein n=1 Tax=Aeromicrobium sp. TaxID=1871063 RepID=UPI0039E5DE61